MTEANKTVDPQLLQFIESESQRQRFQGMVHNLTDQCWDICMPERPASKLDSKTETCLNNCVNRFIDASAFILNRLGEIQTKKSSSFG